MSVRRRLRRWRRSFRRLAGETTAAAFQVADAMLRPTPQVDGQQPTSVVLDDPIVTLDGRRLPNVERVIVHKHDVGPGTSSHGSGWPPPGEHVERMRREHARRGPGMH